MHDHAGVPCYRQLVARMPALDTIHAGLDNGRHVPDSRLGAGSQVL